MRKYIAYLLIVAMSAMILFGLALTLKMYVDSHVPSGCMIPFIRDTLPMCGRIL